MDLSAQNPGQNNRLL